MKLYSNLEKKHCGMYGMPLVQQYFPPRSTCVCEYIISLSLSEFHDDTASSLYIVQFQLYYVSSILIFIKLTILGFHFGFERGSITTVSASSITKGASHGLWKPLVWWRWWSLDWKKISSNQILLIIWSFSQRADWYYSNDGFGKNKLTCPSESVQSKWWSHDVVPNLWLNILLRMNVRLGHRWLGRGSS